MVEDTKYGDDMFPLLNEMYADETLRTSFKPESQGQTHKNAPSAWVKKAAKGMKIHNC